MNKPPLRSVRPAQAIRLGKPKWRHESRTSSCKDTEELLSGKRVRRWVNIERPALRKPEQLDWSAVLDDRRAPPGNQLEALKGDRLPIVQHPPHGRGRCAPDRPRLPPPAGVPVGAAQVPKRLRYYLQRDKGALNAALRIFLRVVQQSL